MWVPVMCGIIDCKKKKEKQYDTDERIVGLKSVLSGKLV